MDLNNVMVSTLLVFYMLLRGESPRFFGLHVGFSIIQTSCRSLGPRARMESEVELF